MSCYQCCFPICSYNNGLLVIGGTVVETHIDGAIRNILWYDPDNEVYVEMEQQLKEPALEPTMAFFVPEEFADCQ